MKHAPGPKGDLIWGSLGEFQRDSLAFFTRETKEHGNIVRFRFGPVIVHLLNHPDHIEHVLSRNARGYDKNTRSARRIAETTGDSLLSANTQAWGRHRRLIQPAFQPNCFDDIGPLIDTALTPMLDRWQDVEAVDIVDEMMQLVIGIVIKVMFSTDIDSRRLCEPLEVVLADTWRRIEAPLDPSMLSRHLHRPTFKHAVKKIDEIVLEIIKKRRLIPEQPDDVLSRLLMAHQIENDMQLSDVELRDAAVTLLLSGHETTANALSWAFIHASDGHEAADPTNIFAEAIRMYPSIWMIERRALADDTIAGCHIPKGSAVLISPYLLHRNAEFWPDPERFDPSRFDGKQTRPRLSYLPFGLGPHRCVGLHLANTIAEQVIKSVFARYRLTCQPDQAIDVSATLTLRHKSKVLMAVTAL